MDEAEYLIKLGKAIKAHRERIGMNQSALALACDTDRQNMSRIEQGRVNITVLTLNRIAQALNISAKDLLDFE
jgi:transcriptional regulator with XRE-family HTH domain